MFLSRMFCPHATVVVLLHIGREMLVVFCKVLLGWVHFRIVAGFSLSEERDERVFAL